MKHRIALTTIIFALIAVLCFTSCDPNTAANTDPSADEVAIPIFFEGSSKALDCSDMNDYQIDLLKKYLLFPPFFGFKTGVINNGQSIHITIAGLPIELIASINSDGSCTFEGSTDWDYLKLTTNNKTNKYSFVHVVSYKSTGTITTDHVYILYEVFVIIGSGDIKGNGFEGINQMYGLSYSEGYGIQKSKHRHSFTSFGNGTKTGAFVYLGKQVDDIDFDLPEGGFPVDNYEQYISMCSTINQSPKYILYLYDGDTFDWPIVSTISDCQTYLASKPGYEDWVLSIPDQ